MFAAFHDQSPLITMIKCKERSVDCTSALTFVLSILRPSRNAIELQIVSSKNVNKYCLHISVYLLSLLTFTMVLMTWMWWDDIWDDIFSLLHAEWRIWMPKSVTECWLKRKNPTNWIWFMSKCLFFRTNKRIFAILGSFSRSLLLTYFLVMKSKSRKMTPGSSFSPQNDAGSRAHYLVLRKSCFRNRKLRFLLL